MAGGGSYCFRAGDTEVELSADDIEIRHQDAEGLATTFDGEAFVALDTAITPELKREATLHQRTRVLERLQDDYGIDPAAELPAAASTDFEGEPIEVPADRQELDAAIEELRRKLGSIGSVNLEALAESEALATRLAELEGQLADVTAA